MSTLNDKIFDAIEKNCVGYGSNPTIGKQDAANEIEKLVLQEKINLLNEVKGDFRGEAWQNCNNKISELTNQLKALS